MVTHRWHNLAKITELPCKRIHVLSCRFPFRFHGAIVTDVCDDIGYREAILTPTFF